MHILFVHQNFPAQFRFIAPRLAKDYGHRCTFVTERAEGELPGVEKVVYQPRGGATIANHVCTRNFENTVAHSHGVFEALKARADLKPDLIVAHSGFGSSLFLPFLYDGPIINFLEFYYHPVGQDLGYRPEVPVDELNLLRSRTNNAMILLDLINCDRGWTPTHYQKAFFPEELRGKIEVIFDGIETSVYQRKSGASDRVRAEMNVPSDHRIVTYVARGFEMMRGFDIFMKAARRIYQQFDKVTFIVVGTDKIHYGGDQRYIKEKSFRHHVINEGGYDLARFRFPGYVPQETLADILSAGDLHIYLTEPFIASWSMVDAMACGAVLLASDQTCVREYVEPGRNGLLVDFFDFENLAAQAVQILNDPAAYRHLAEAAVKTVQEKFSLDVAMPRINEFFQRVAAVKRPQSLLLEKLIKVGSLPVVAPEPQTSSGGESNLPVTVPSAGLFASDTKIAADQLDPNSDLAKAVNELRRVANGPVDPISCVKMAQSYHGPPGALEWIGPRNHPIDLARMAQRVMQWQPQIVLDLGAVEGGTVFIWSRMAAANATIIVAPAAGQVAAPEKIAFFPYMLRKQQTIRCLPPAGPEELEKAIDAVLQGRKIDVLFLHGRRDYQSLEADFRRYMTQVRPGGLIGWDGINMLGKTADNDGADRLWAQIKPRYPQHAEYLNGTSSEVGGIAMIKT